MTQIHFESSYFRSFNFQLKLKCSLPESCNISPCVPLDLTIQTSLGFDSLSSQLKPHYNLPKDRDLLTSVLLQIDDSRIFSYSGFACFNISPLPPFGSHDPLTHILLAINGQDHTSGVSSPPCPQTFGVVDLTPPIFLDDGRSLLTSGL
jgi:hypothetical protein